MLKSKFKVYKTKDNPIVHQANPLPFFLKIINHAKRGAHRKYENI